MHRFKFWNPETAYNYIYTYNSKLKSGVTQLKIVIPDAQNFDSKAQRGCVVNTQG